MQKTSSINNTKHFKLPRLNSLRIIALSFFIVILIGAILLSLPISSKNGTFTNFLDCIFTATSATCVTGLIVFDTFTQWTVFGQCVILLLIQIGGLGFMTLLTILMMFAKRHVTLHEMRLLTQSAGSVRKEGIFTLVRHILFGTVIIEALGAIVLSFVFCPDMGFGQGLYFAVFHSVSAFCNAGFDLLGCRAPFSSLTSYSTNITLNLTISALIIIGGIGFYVWDDLIRCRFRFKKLELHSKAVLIMTFTLLISGWILFFATEYNHALADKNFGEKLLSSFFQSVTTRTAGFDAINQANLSDSGVLLSVFFMLIGGSPGSTAGGIKTTTVAVIIFSTIACAKGHDSTVIFKRRIEPSTVRQAHTTAAVYLFMAITSVMLICSIDGISLRDCIFEVASAIGTVGLTTGITPSLSAASHVILILLMYAGRLGAMSLMLVFADKENKVPLERPYGKIIIG